MISSGSNSVPMGSRSSVDDRFGTGARLLRIGFPSIQTFFNTGSHMMPSKPGDEFILLKAIFKSSSFLNPLYLRIMSFGGGSDKDFNPAFEDCVGSAVLGCDEARNANDVNLF